jgi:hypothetical protein
MAVAFAGNSTAIQERLSEGPLGQSCQFPTKEADVFPQQPFLLLYCFAKIDAPSDGGDVPVEGISL